MADVRCGVGRLKRALVLQRFASLFWFTVVSMFLTLAITASYTYMSSIQTTTQAVFSLTAQDVGIWYAMFEVGIIMSNLVVSYALSKHHIPRVLAVGAFLVTISSAMHAIPHLFANYSEKVQSVSEVKSADDFISATLCRAASIFSGDNHTVTETPLLNQTHPDAHGVNPNTAQSSSVGAMLVFCIAGLINGVGYAPTYAMTMAYIADNAPGEGEHSASPYIGAFLASYSIGPILGYGMGSAALSIYVNLQETYLTPADDEWLGAWWMGYLVFGGLLSLMVLPLAMFPKVLPDAHANKTHLKDQIGGFTEMESKDDKDTLSDRLSITSSSERVAERQAAAESEPRSFREFFPTLLRLLTNPLYALEVTASCFGAYYIAGWASYVPKYFEDQFLMSANLASILAGVLPVVIAAPVIFLAGWISARLNLTLQQDAKVVFFSVFGSAVMLVPLLFLKCEQFPTQPVPSNLTTCVSAASCSCSEDDFTPVCYDGTSYQSPCLSGCTGFYTDEGNKKVYTGCFCDMNRTMTKGVCRNENCTASYIYTALNIISSAMWMGSATCAVTVLIRAVPAEDKSFALGVQSIMNSLLGWIPAPILYGWLIDTACVRWEYPEGAADDPEWKGYCLEYDNDDYRWKYVGASLAAMAVASFFCGLAWRASYLPRYRSTSNGSTRDETHRTEPTEAGESESMT